MVFQLTDGLADKIVNALENQEQHFYLDAEECVLVESSSVDRDDDRFYLLPEWNSERGFELRQNFAESLHSNKVQRALFDILHSGRGVFRNFKNELKQYPEIEKLWYQYKNSKMRNFVGEWYNNLREIWGLEKLELTSEETDDLLKADFIFQKYCSDDYKNIIIQFSDAEYDFNCDWPQEIHESTIELWRRQFLSEASDKQIGFICRSLSNEFAGCITVAPILDRMKNVVFLTSFFVPQKFRGLGIGTELMNKCLSFLKVLKKEWILLANIIIPESIEPLLLRSGFQKLGSGYSARIQ